MQKNPKTNEVMMITTNAWERGKNSGTKERSPGKCWEKYNICQTWVSRFLSSIEETQWNSNAEHKGHATKETKWSKHEANSSIGSELAETYRIQEHLYSILCYEFSLDEVLIRTFQPKNRIHSLTWKQNHMTQQSTKTHLQKMATV